MHDRLKRNSNFTIVFSKNSKTSYLGMWGVNPEAIDWNIALPTHISFWGSVSKKKTLSDVPSLTIKCIQGKVFGPQPFLSIKTKKKRYIHDNLDFSKDKQVWHYAFHGDTLSINDVDEIGVAANDRFGNTHIKRLKFKSDETFKEF